MHQQLTVFNVVETIGHYSVTCPEINSLETRRYFGQLGGIDHCLLTLAYFTTHGFGGGGPQSSPQLCGSVLALDHLIHTLVLA